MAACIMKQIIFSGKECENDKIVMRENILELISQLNNISLIKLYSTILKTITVLLILFSLINLMIGLILLLILKKY